MMTARSLFVTFIRMGMEPEQAIESCRRQEIFSEKELNELEEK